MTLGKHYYLTNPLQGKWGAFDKAAKSCKIGECYEISYMLQLETNDSKMIYPIHISTIYQSKVFVLFAQESTNAGK